MSMSQVVFVVVGPGGVESVWSTPEAALDAEDAFPQVGREPFIATRPVDSGKPTAESSEAQKRVRALREQRKTAAMRKEWADKLRGHFKDEHDHASGSAECMGCGGEKAADMLERGEL